MDALHDKVRNALEFCDNPFRLAPTTPATIPQPTDIRLATTIARRVHELRRRSFPLAVAYANYRRVLFNDCKDATAFFDRQLEEGARDESCLQRAFYAAKTARSFPSDAVLFIGVLLPTTAMHAWIIEAGQQANAADGAWIMYRPVFAYY